MNVKHVSGLEALIQQTLKPIVREIDEQGVYPVQFLKLLGKHGFFGSADDSPAKLLKPYLALLEEVSSVCVSTGFSLWCHLAGLTYMRCGNSTYIKERILPAMVRGDNLAGTGLSNPMKFYAGLEPLHLKARKTQEGYRIRGTLPFVSNLAPEHWFGVIAEHCGQRLVAVVPCWAQGLTMQEKADFMALNGTGTFCCKFNDTLLPAEWILSEDADQFVLRIRPYFLLTQAAVGLGLIKACIAGMETSLDKQNGVNHFVEIQPEQVRENYLQLRDRLWELSGTTLDPHRLRPILEVRLQVAKLALTAAQGEFLYRGAAAYVLHSPANRRLREAHFMAILTPALKHLSKMLA
ncbi:hypothetical protein GCM10010965_24780 [Caldalkalibacillus thermarum]|uniref:acyl-CoA dehydrogenase family protein n=1 Tax=Caldalkalibacillus thermarum TaxID=296745 RepID=UPI001669C110|nr:acyl-CoA dehydrogenase family protein [Caldalkalibacillus thermarum]GGK31032.1 hypothetical protein GCM10010965_24780 [Caldalkalibacillus thermarum]